jgi:hypothetical protein
MISTPFYPGADIWSTKASLPASAWPLRPCLQRELWIILLSRYSPISRAPDRGEDHHKIQKWIANGWLCDRLQGTQRHDGNGHDIHRFREKDILAFIKKHPQEINLGKTDQTWLLDLVLLRGSEVPETAEHCNVRDGDKDDEAA